MPLLAYCLEAILTITHPFAPFVTETVWQTLAWEGDSLLAVRPWPKVMAGDAKQASVFEQIQAIVTEIRFILSALKVSGITLQYHDAPFIADSIELIKRLTRLKEVVAIEKGSGLALTSTSAAAWLDIDPQTAKSYLNELEAKKDAQKRVVEQLEKRLANKSYVDNAPENIVAQTKQQLEEAKQQLAAIQAEHERFAKA